MRIYFVEQEGIIRGTIRDFLTDLGHVVVVSPVLEDLPEILSRNHEAVDLLVVSILIVDRRALRVLRDVHARYPAIPILVVTESRAALPAGFEIRQHPMTDLLEVTDRVSIDSTVSTTLTARLDALPSLRACSSMPRSRTSSHRSRDRLALGT